MKRALLAATTMLINMALIGCSGGGGGSAPPPTTITQILSDSAIDGDILVPPGTVTEGMTPAVQSVFAGIDPVTLAEYRAFLHFPLSGPNGVPLNASIVSATLDIVIDNIVLQSPGDTVPILIDLVSFTPPLIPGISGDFDRTSLPPLASIAVLTPISSADVGSHVFIDVTPLMAQAQSLALPDFQIRILEDFSAVAPGLFEIDDTTGANRATLAPLLQVEYL